MKKKLLAIIVSSLMIMGLLTSCNVTKSKDTSALDLSGTWRSESDDDSYQEAIISDDVIEIN